MAVLGTSSGSRVLSTNKHNELIPIFINPLHTLVNVYVTVATTEGPNSPSVSEDGVNLGQ